MATAQKDLRAAVQYAKEKKYTKFAEIVKQKMHEKSVATIQDYRKVAFK